MFFIVIYLSGVKKIIIEKDYIAINNCIKKRKIAYSDIKNVDTATLKNWAIDSKIIFITSYSGKKIQTIIRIGDQSCAKY